MRESTVMAGDNTQEVLTKLRRMLSDESQLTWLHTIAVTVLTVYDRAKKSDLSFEVHTMSDLLWDETFILHVGQVQVAFSSNYGMVEDMGATSFFSIEIRHGGTDTSPLVEWTRIKPDGTAVMANESGRECYWWCDEHEDDPHLIGVAMATSIFTCARWHHQRLAGVMPACDTCEHQLACTPRVQYVIRV